MTKQELEEKRRNILDQIGYWESILAIKNKDLATIERELAALPEEERDLSYNELAELGTFATYSGSPSTLRLIAEVKRRRKEHVAMNEESMDPTRERLRDVGPNIMERTEVAHHGLGAIYGFRLCATKAYFYGFFPTEVVSASTILTDVAV